MAALVEAAAAHHGHIDVCVMNSAYPATRMPVDLLDDGQMRAAYEALVFAPMQLAGHVAPHMKRRKSGKLIFCTSAAPLRVAIARRRTTPRAETTTASAELRTPCAEQK